MGKRSVGGTETTEQKGETKEAGRPELGQSSSVGLGIPDELDELNIQNKITDNRERTVRIRKKLTLGPDEHTQGTFDARTAPAYIGGNWRIVVLGQTDARTEQTGETKEARPSRLDKQTGGRKPRPAEEEKLLEQPRVAEKTAPEKPAEPAKKAPTEERKPGLPAPAEAKKAEQEPRPPEKKAWAWAEEKKALEQPRVAEKTAPGKPAEPQKKAPTEERKPVKGSGAGRAATERGYVLPDAMAELRLQGRITIADNRIIWVLRKLVLGDKEYTKGTFDEKTAPDYVAGSGRIAVLGQAKAPGQKAVTINRDGTVTEDLREEGEVPARRPVPDTAGRQAEEGTPRERGTREPEARKTQAEYLVPGLKRAPEPADSSARGKVLARRGSPVLSLAFSPEGRWLVTGHEDGSFIVWSMEKRELVNRVEAARLGIKQAFFRPRGDALVTVSKEGQAGLWEATGWRPFNKALGIPQVACAAFSPDGKTLACAQTSGRIALLDLATAEVRYLRGHDNSALWAAFSRSGRTLVTGGADNVVRVWNLTSDKPLGKVCLGHHDWVERVGIAGEERVFSAGADRVLRVWDIAKAEAIGQVAEFGEPILELCLTPDGDRLAVVLADGSIHVLGSESGQEVEVLTGPAKGAAVTAAAFAPDGRYLAGGFNNGRVEIWSAEDWKLVRTAAGTASPPGAVEGSKPVDAAKYYDSMREAGKLVEAAKLEEAAKLYEEASSLQPNCMVPVEAAGDVYARLEQWGKALAWYEKALRLRPESVFLRLKRCRVLVHTGEREEAIRGLNSIAKEAPDLATPHLRLAEAYCDAGQWAEAVRSAGQALELEPESYDAHLSKGWALMGQKNWAAAITSLRQSLALNPDVPAAYAALVNCCLSSSPPAVQEAQKVRSQAEERKIQLPTELLDLLRKFE